MPGQATPFWGGFFVKCKTHNNKSGLKHFTAPNYARIILRGFLLIMIMIKIINSYEKHGVFSKLMKRVFKKIRRNMCSVYSWGVLLFK